MSSSGRWWRSSISAASARSCPKAPPTWRCPEDRPCSDCCQRRLALREGLTTPSGEHAAIPETVAMAVRPKKKESPAEPFKRVLGLTVRAIAGDDEVQVSYAPGKPEIDGKLVQLPEPSRVPSRREVAVIRGWADSLALTAACHHAKLHARLAPKAGPARAVFEAVERARVEALGANRMPGMAANLTARVEDQYGHGRFAEITDRAEAPLEDALALIV